nr:4-coumarate--CoA ligase-like 7 [Onthophagus taurus]
MYSKRLFVKNKICQLKAGLNPVKNVRRLCLSIENENVIVPRVPNFQVNECLLSEYVWKNLDRWENKTAVVCAETERSYTYSQVRDKSKNVAVFLKKALKLTKTETVAIFSPNVPEYCITLFACIEAGLKVTTINPIYTKDEIKRQLINSNTKVVFTVTDLYSTARDAISSIPQKEISIVVIQDKPHVSLPSGAIKFDEISSYFGSFTFEQQTNTDVACLPYSSGTTGTPKGVELTHRNLVSNLQQIQSDEFRLNRVTEGNIQDVVPVILPMYHIYGLTVILMNMFSQGCKLVTVPKFGTDIFLKILDHFKPNVFYAVPPIMLMMLNNKYIRAEQLKSIHQVVCSAAPLGVADIEKFFVKTQGKVKFMQIYGMTECSPIILHQSPVLDKGRKVGASGLLVANTLAKIVQVDDPNDTNLGQFENGELLVKGPQVMKGYHNNPEATKATINENGWIRTGDIAYYDEDGQFYITDRLKELIKVKGFQVAPAELEEVLRSHPAVADAAVIGIPHQQYGEAPKAFVALKKDHKANAEDIRSFVAGKVAPYKDLTGGVIILEKIPKTASGKTLRRDLKQLC